jgi:hypothetical protein
MLGALAGALKSGPRWMLTYQPDDGTEKEVGTTVTMLPAPDPSAMSCCSAYATPPGAAHFPKWMCETWLEPAASPVSLTVSVKVPSLFTTSAVPATEVPFCAAIGKLIFAAGEGVAEVPPPHAAMTRTLSRARIGFFTHS